MPEFKVLAKVIEIRGQGACSYGHTVGETFVLSEKGSPICNWAQNSLFPFYTVLQFGGKFPWGEDPDRLQVACPDPNNVVVFELWREPVS